MRRKEFIEALYVYGGIKGRTGIFHLYIYMYILY